jgi:hypothetical protein
VGQKIPQHFFLPSFQSFEKEIIVGGPMRLIQRLWFDHVIYASFSL